MKKRILVDMDGILVDLLAKWLGTYNEETGDDLTKQDIHTWETHEHATEMAPDDFHDILKRPGYYDDLEPLPGAIEGFKALRNSGHVVCVCTSAASDDSARAKIAWCAEHLGIGRRDVIITHKKIWLAGTCDVLIDDKPANIEGWAKAGKDAYSIAWNYNKSSREHCKLMADDFRDTEKAWHQLVAALT